MASNNTGVEGIPTHALDAIQDQNVSSVLRALVNGWNVRNGSAGKGDAAFITKADLKSQVKTIISQSGVDDQSSAGGSGVSPAAANKIVTQLQASILSSENWKQLGERIELLQIDTSQNAAEIQEETQKRLAEDSALVEQVNTQYTAINQNLAAIQQQQMTTSNSVSALAQQTSTLQTTVNGNTSAIQQEALTRANTDGQMLAKYSVKIDQNGYVTGYGLMSQANNGTPVSSFIVRADKFAIGSPSGPGIAPIVPFIVTTTPETLPDGTVIPPGVYMDYAMVKRLDGAYINGGLIQAAKIYTGSQYVDFDSKQDISVVANGNYQTYSITPPSNSMSSISANLRFYGPDLHAYCPYMQRVRSCRTRNLQFVVSAAGVVDHWFTAWYRKSSMPAGWWYLVNQVTEPQNGYGSAAFTAMKELFVADGEYVEFTVSTCSKDWVTFNTSSRDIQDLTVNVSCINL